MADVDVRGPRGGGYWGGRGQPQSEGGSVDGVGDGIVIGVEQALVDAGGLGVGEGGEVIAEDAGTGGGVVMGGE